jgi:hypothetical protein
LRSRKVGTPLDPFEESGDGVGISTSIAYQSRSVAGVSGGPPSAAEQNELVLNFLHNRKVVSHLLYQLYASTVMMINRSSVVAIE